MPNTFHFTPKSGNVKTGPIPTTITDSSSCPSSCGMFDSCYAKSGNLNIHWQNVNTGKRSITLDELLSKIRALPDDQLFRHNTAGDLPGKDERIDGKVLRRIVRASKGKRGFTYTHKPMTPNNQRAVAAANRNGFTINLSANSPAQADKLKALNVGPVVTVVPHDVNENFTTPAGNLVVICPATQRDDISCGGGTVLQTKQINNKLIKTPVETHACKLCAWKDRDVIIGFPLHGSRRGRVQVDMPATANQLVQIEAKG